MSVLLTRVSLLTQEETTYVTRTTPPVQKRKLQSLDRVPNRSTWVVDFSDRTPSETQGTLTHPWNRREVIPRWGSEDVVSCRTLSGASLRRLGNPKKKQGNGSTRETGKQRERCLRESRGDYPNKQWSATTKEIEGSW